MKGKRFLAIDIGASSGRTILGTLSDGKLMIEETHRFINEPVSFPDGLYWDMPNIFKQIGEGIKATASRFGEPDSIGIDTWGVDFAFLDRSGGVCTNPMHYRDSRTDGMMDEAFKHMSKRDIFSKTGLAFLPFNTLYQLLAMRGKPQLEIADKLLFMPDLLSYLLTGEVQTEYTIASTSQLINPVSRRWSDVIINAFGFCPHWFTELHEPGGVRGNIRRELRGEYGLKDDVPVAFTASHDTASAVCAVPSDDGGFHAYISSGTWSLLGVLLDKPIITDAVLAGNYTNEGGAFGKTRLLKNIMGLWILQECRRKWRLEGADVSYADLAARAGLAEPFRMFFDPDAPEFLPPGDMESRIRSAAASTGQDPPETMYQVSRVIYENLALKYRWAVSHLENEILHKKIGRLHIVGGGSQNALLNQMTANSLGIPVYAGPAEATAIGNIAMQAIALGELSGESDIRRIVRASFAPEEYLPQDTQNWDDAYRRFLKVTGLPE